jgi:hypothetical protein
MSMDDLADRLETAVIEKLGIGVGVADKSLAREIVSVVMQELDRSHNRGALNTDPLLQFFAYDHLPCRLQPTSALFGSVATTVVETVPHNPARDQALCRLLEAKDAAVRAMLWKDE